MLTFSHVCHSECGKDTEMSPDTSPKAGFLELRSPSISKACSRLRRPLLALSYSSAVHSVCRMEMEGLSLNTLSLWGSNFFTFYGNVSI